jgi:hypothetical protein
MHVFNAIVERLSMANKNCRELDFKHDQQVDFEERFK